MWDPAPEKQKELAFLLEATQQPGADHREVLDRLDLYKSSDAFNSHLAHVFAFGKDFSELVRLTASYCIANVCTHHLVIHICLVHCGNQSPTTKQCTYLVN